MPFCESCHAEYEAGTQTCAECNVALVDSLPEGSSAEMTDIYECYDAQQAERAAEVLVTEGIEVLVRDRSSSAFPTNVGTTAKQLVAVSESDSSRGRELIHAAVHDGVLASDGKVLGG